MLVAGSAASLLDDGSRGEVGDGEFIVGDFLATAVDSLRLTDPID